MFEFSNANRCTSHGKEKKGCTALHNAPGVSVSTILTSTRHSVLPTGAQYDHGTRENMDRGIAALSHHQYPGQSECTSLLPNSEFNYNHNTTESSNREPTTAMSTHPDHCQSECSSLWGDNKMGHQQMRSQTLVLSPSKLCNHLWII